MNKVLEFVMYYAIYLVIGFLGVWIGSLIIGLGTNPFTSWIPYITALIFTLPDFILNKNRE